MLTEEKVTEVVEVLAESGFVNPAFFNHDEIAQILKIWREHPEHPRNKEEE